MKVNLAPTALAIMIFVGLLFSAPTSVTFTEETMLSSTATIDTTQVEDLRPVVPELATYWITSEERS